LLLVALFPAANGHAIDTDSSRETSHHITFGADIVIFGFMIWYVTGMAASAPKSHPFLTRWGPSMAVSLGCLLLIIDPTRHILLDHGGIFFEERSLAMYARDGGLSPIGHFCQVAAIIGFTALILGVMWHMRVPEAIMRKFAAGTTEEKLL
jgi:hypothetical protein